MTNPSVEAEKLLAGARAACHETGLAPSQIGDLFLNEAMLAWMMDGLSEHEIHQKLTEAMQKTLREWFYRARLATGQCDCVREVHMAGQQELLGNIPAFMHD